MSEVFGADYASWYDALYADKDYDAEVARLERIFASGPRQVRTVLDLGCGTGQHAVRLAALGHDVTGVDRSAEMLRVAAARGGNVELVRGDVRSVRLGRTFDAVVMMFAVLGYQTNDEDLHATLETVRAHLAPGGVSVCDVWHGPAVLATGLSERVKSVATATGDVTRIARATHDEAAHCVDVDYQLALEGGATISERHRMRYFFPRELRSAFTEAGLVLESLRSWDERSAEPSDETWNVAAVARRPA